jgi:hypothetical protein
MGTSTDRTQALRLLNGLEMGGLDLAEGRVLVENLDPVLVHLIVRFLREVYPVTAPAARPVLERVVALTNATPKIVALAKEGEADPITAWFVSEYTFAEFRGRGHAMLDLVVDKLES